jgi:Xaa-Pro aminopeptidase
VEAGHLFKQLRIVKSEEEIERLRRAAALNQSAFLAMVEHVREGVTEAELMRIHRETLAAKGATAALNSGGVGTRSGAPFLPPAPYPMKQGDIFRFDATGTLNCYWADFGRTAVLGEPSAKVARYYGALFGGFKEGLSLIRAGARVDDIFHAVMDSVRANGIEHYRRHHVGHGIGIEVYDSPIIGPAGPSDIFKEGSAGSTLEENMVICLEVPYYELGFGGLQIEDTLRVTRDGYERLTTISQELYVC